MESKRLTKPALYVKIIKLILNRIIKGKWQIPDVTEITGDDLLERINSDHPQLLIDVRSDSEFNSSFGHIPKSISLPMMQFESDFENTKIFEEKVLEATSNFEDLQSYKKREVVTICPGGGMSLIAAEILAKQNFKHVNSLKGGIDSWFKKDYPTTRS